MGPKISVIVPVYNAENYLHRCIDSILAQTFTDFELLLIDDGSPDKSGVICDEYAQKDSRIRVFHKENGGVSSARNLGLKECKGERICFVDSDDEVDNKYIKSLIEYSDDIVVQGYYKKNNSVDSTTPNFIDCIYRGRNNDIDQFIEILYNSNNLGYIWGRMYNTQIIKNNNIFFDERISYQEDTDFFLRYLIHAKTYTILNEGHYCYYSSDFETKYNIHYSERILYAIKILNCLHQLLNNFESAVYIQHINILGVNIYNMLYDNSHTSKDADYFIDEFIKFQKPIKDKSQLRKKTRIVSFIISITISKNRYCIMRLIIKFISLFNRHL